MDSRVENVITIMHRRLADPLSMEGLSRSVNLSRSRLRQIFVKEIGRSPMNYLKEIRMRTAERLLQSTFLSIKEVASRTGAGDVSHFVRDFRKRHRLTPTEYRVQNRVLTKCAMPGDE